MSGIKISPQTPSGPMVDEKGYPTPAWQRFFSLCALVLNADVQSGTTAQRPNVNLWAGRPYFDRSLGANWKCIFVNADASGWVDGDGNSV